VTGAVTLQFSTSLAWQSAVIRRICHSPFSHVDIVLDDGTCLGASDPGGVAIRPSDYQQFGIRRRCDIVTDKADAIIARARSQLHKPFDDGALHAFLSGTLAPRDWRAADKWFCSEHVAWSFETEGFWPFNLLVGQEGVSPADLLLLLNPHIDADAFWKPVEGLALGVHET
jgi:hypothetical protein